MNQVDNCDEMTWSFQRNRWTSWGGQCFIHPVPKWMKIIFLFEFQKSEMIKAISVYWIKSSLWKRNWKKKEASVFSFSASWHWACCFCCCCCFLVLWSLLPARCIYEKLFLTVCYFGQLFWPFADHCNWLRIGNAIHQTQSFIFHFSQLALASSAAHCTDMPIRLNLVCYKFNCIGIERVHSSAWWKLKQTD